MAPKARVKNEAEPKDIKKVLKGLDFTFKSGWQLMDYDDFIEEHEDVLSDIVRVTKRPVYSVVATALRQHCKHVTESDADAFGKKVATSVSYARMKKHSVSSGKKQQLPQCDCCSC